MKGSIKSLVLLCLLAIFYTSLNAQFYLKGGVLFNQAPGKEDISAGNTKDLFEGQKSFTLGVGQELTLFKLLGLDLGINYFDIKQSLIDQSSDPENLSNKMGAVSAIIRIKPTKYFDVGVGIMPAVSVKRDESIFEKSIDVAGVASVSINPFKAIGIELNYNTGFLPYGKILYRDTSGANFSEVQFKNSFYTLALKLKM